MTHDPNRLDPAAELRNASDAGGNPVPAGAAPLPSSVRSFDICDDHRDADWNQPGIDDEACVLCHLFYLEAQEQLLEEWQGRAVRAEQATAEVQRPLDAQMGRLNETVTRLNGELDEARAALRYWMPAERPKYGAPGSRDTDVAEEMAKWDRWQSLRDTGSANTETHGVNMPPDLHPTTKQLVLRFAQALAEKLYAAEQKYGYDDGWSESAWEAECREKLYEHLAKGDPRDVANFCAFMWHHGWSTERPLPSSVEAKPDIERDLAALRAKFDALGQSTDRIRDGRALEVDCFYFVQRHVLALTYIASAKEAHPEILEALSYYRFQRDDMTLDELVEVIRHGYVKVRERTTRQLELQLCEVLAAAPAPVVGPPPASTLTEAEGGTP